MSGNVWEWNDLTGATSSTRGLRGGGCLGDDQVSTDRREAATNFTDSYPGFRLAAVPESSTWVMALAGLACGGWGLLRRYRAPSP